mmetsp:Transcript_105335/g.187252  ORF Transcript_105335/g.187252 Transcript_105335/m.187252 type:complete len:232 (-) Transcript_105335:73-768(-)
MAGAVLELRGSSTSETSFEAAATSSLPRCNLLAEAWRIRGENVLGSSFLGPAEDARCNRCSARAAILRPGMNTPLVTGAILPGDGANKSPSWLSVQEALRRPKPDATSPAGAVCTSTCAGCEGRGSSCKGSRSTFCCRQAPFATACCRGDRVGVLGLCGMLGLGDFCAVTCLAGPERAGVGSAEIMVCTLPVVRPKNLRFFSIICLTSKRFCSISISSSSADVRALFGRHS